LQRLRRQVFPQPELIMANLRVLADHLGRKLAENKSNYFAHWQVVQPFCSPGGKDYYLDSAGNFWRMISYIEGVAGRDRVRDVAQAQEMGQALGFFHRLLSDLDPTLLADTLPGFHVTPQYLANYDRLLLQPEIQISNDEEEYCCQVIEEHRSIASVLEDAARQGLLPIRVIHGDPKLTNIMFDEISGRAQGLVDLDTVKPGLLHYDIGDCLRSSCNPVGDRFEKLYDVRFDSEICRHLLGGYLTEMAPLLTPTDYEYIYPAVKLLTFELGLRFFTDHLAGDQYFKVNYHGQNLLRAMAQFRLLASIDDSETVITNIVQKCRYDM